VVKICEIQFIKRINKPLNQNDKKQFINLMRKGAVSNKDAFGLFTNSITFKSKSKVEDKIKNDILLTLVNEANTNWLVGHNRLTTQGKEDDNENNHPFETDNFKIVHNGIITNDKELKEEYKLKYTVETDSAIFPYLLEYKLKNNKDNKTFIELVRDTIELITGSYSIFLLDKRNDNLYYFKSSSTNFTFNLYEDGISKIIVGSTSESNLEEIYKKNWSIFDIEESRLLSSVEADDGFVYKIDDNGIYPVCNFEQKYATYINKHHKEKDLSKKYNMTETEYRAVEDCIASMEDCICTIAGTNCENNTDWKNKFVVYKLKVCNEETKKQVITELGYGIPTKKGIKLSFDELLEYFDVSQGYLNLDNKIQEGYVFDTETGKFHDMYGNRYDNDIWKPSKNETIRRLNGLEYD
jgi:hypothetical protein